MPGGTTIQLAIDRGVAFLERRQRADGELPVCASGTPDPAVFPTAVVAQALSDTPAARHVRDRALDFLEAEMDPRGLWRHWPARHPQHTVIPPDLDDTACASAALAQAGRRVPANHDRLLGNRTSSGLFRTWVITRVEARHPLTLYGFFRRTSAKPFDVDAVVNANVLHYLGPGPHAGPVVAHLAAIMRDGPFPAAWAISACRRAPWTGISPGISAYRPWAAGWRRCSTRLSSSRPIRGW